jgi:hypothetical protein
MFEGRKVKGELLLILMVIAAICPSMCLAQAGQAQDDPVLTYDFKVGDVPADSFWQNLFEAFDPWAYVTREGDTIMLASLESGSVRKVDTLDILLQKKWIMSEGRFLRLLSETAIRPLHAQPIAVVDENDEIVTADSLLFRRTIRKNRGNRKRDKESYWRLFRLNETSYRVQELQNRNWVNRRQWDGVPDEFMIGSAFKVKKDSLKKDIDRSKNRGIGKGK